MGNDLAIPEDFTTPFDADEIRRLSKRFKKLDVDNSGSLSVEEFRRAMPEHFDGNPLSGKIIQLFDSDGNGEVDFKEFIEGMSQFSVKGGTTGALSKLMFAYRIYDYDNDGLVSVRDLFNTLKLMVGENLNEEQVAYLVGRTFSYQGLDIHSYLTFQDFCEIAVRLDLHNRLVLKKV